MPTDKTYANIVLSRGRQACPVLTSRVVARVSKAFQQTGNIVTAEEQRKYLIAVRVPQGAIMVDVDAWSEEFLSVSIDYHMLHSKGSATYWRMAEATQSPESVMLNILRREVQTYWRMRPTLQYKYNNEVIKC